MFNFFAVAISGGIFGALVGALCVRSVFTRRIREIEGRIAHMAANIATDPNLIGRVAVLESKDRHNQANIEAPFKLYTGLVEEQLSSLRRRVDEAERGWLGRTSAT